MGGGGAARRGGQRESVDLSAWHELVNLIDLYRSACAAAAGAGTMDAADGAAGGGQELPGWALQDDLLLPLTHWAVEMGNMDFIRTELGTKSYDQPTPK